MMDDEASIYGRITGGGWDYSGIWPTPENVNTSWKLVDVCSVYAGYRAGCAGIGGRDKRGMFSLATLPYHGP